MLISVIIPVFNAGALLSRAVTSVFATGVGSVEVLIVDDGSTDDSWRVACALAARCPDSVRALRHPGGVHCGVSASRNLGIRSARGELIAFLDADDYYYPHRFDVSVKTLSTDASVDAVYDTADIVYASPEAASRVSWGSHTFGIRDPLTGDPLIQVLLSSQTWQCLGIVCRRTLFDRAGLFDERLRIAEDCNLWIRMALVGRIVAGDLAKPVGVYWRHAVNTFNTMPEHHVAYIRALVYACRWAAGVRGLSEERLKIMRSGLTTQTVRSIVVCRELGRQDLAWRSLAELLRHGGLHRDALRPLAWQAQALVREGLGFRVGVRRQSPSVP